jgi:ankyrin repeat protein
MLDAQPGLIRSKTPAHGETALHWLAIENHVAGVRFLLARRAAVDEPTNSGETPLMSAARLGYVELCSVLLQAGANVNAVDENQDSVVHHAAASGNVEVLKLLVSAGADLSRKNTLGETAQDLAPPHLRNAVIKALSSASGRAG